MIQRDKCEDFSEDLVFMDLEINGLLSVSFVGLGWDFLDAVGMAANESNREVRPSMGQFK